MVPCASSQTHVSLSREHEVYMSVPPLYCLEKSVKPFSKFFIISR